MTEQELDLALRQVEETASLPGKNSAVVRCAQAFDRKRRAFKKSARLFFRRLFKKPAAKPQDRLKLLVHVRGGIGDVCMTRPLIKHMRRRFPQALLFFCYDDPVTVQIVFSDGLIDGWVSRKYDPLEYDLVIAGCHAFNFDHYDLPRLQRLAPEWMGDFEKARALQQKLRTITNNTPHLDGLWAKISTEYGSARVANTGLTAGFAVDQNEDAIIAPDIQKQEEILNRFALADKKYITIHDGTNTNTNLHGRQATRCWPRAHWEQFGRMFKKRFPNITLVQLGGANSTPYDFADVCLVGKTAVSDLPHLLKKALFHIDGESGMVQLARRTGTRCIVMFGPTPLPYFAYEKNINLRAGECHECMNIYSDWMSHCPLFESNRCMAAIKPEMVLAAAENLMASTTQKA